LPAQVLGELFNVLVRKGRRSPLDARRIVATWQDIYLVAPTTRPVLTLAFDLAIDHQLATWDAVIMTVAVEAGCRVLPSEDMHDGFAWGGVTIVNPFALSPNRLLGDLRSNGR
jgi:predicted nucleic acid-binding protein